MGLRGLVGAAASGVLIASCSFLPESSPTASGSPPPPSAGPFASASASIAAPSVAALPTPAATGTPLPRPLASSGTIVTLRGDGSLWLVGTDGRTAPLSPPGDATGVFPAWSPDGTRVAEIRYGMPGNEIVIHDVARALAGDPAAAPAVLLRSGSIGPFYIAWSPDGAAILYLADESGGLSLRTVPADGSAPVDGSGPGSRVRTGNPFYFSFVRPNELLAHVGSGPSAFLGEIGMNGAPSADPIQVPGEFRSAVVSGDGTWIAFARGGPGEEQVVVAARDGSSEQAMPVFGMAAVAFDPTGDTVASIGPIEASSTAYAIPIGPLRVIDPKTGAVRTLVNDAVVSFWWSPDGKTIAALAVPASDDASPQPSAAAATPTATTASRSGVQLLFVDVASGRVDARFGVDPGQLFIDQFLTYFDQYAISHRVWAPDSSSLLVPVVDADGATHVGVFFRDGADPVTIDGVAGFWSP